MSDMLGGISSMYANTDYSQATSQLEDKLKNTDYSKASEEELMEVCKSFEAYFLEQVFKGMEKMIPKDDDDDSGMNHVDMFKDTLYQEYAKSATERGDGIGLAKQLFEQMKRNYGIK